jgi:hypothetical protein
VLLAFGLAVAGRLAGGSNPLKSSSPAQRHLRLRVLGSAVQVAAFRVVLRIDQARWFGNGMRGQAPRGVRLFGRRKALQAEPQEC